MAVTPKTVTGYKIQKPDGTFVALAALPDDLVAQLGAADARDARRQARMTADQFALYLALGGDSAFTVAACDARWAAKDFTVAQCRLELQILALVLSTP